MVGAHRLPLQFDAPLLLQDVREVEKQAAWIDHWGGERAEWGVIPLISSDGDHRTRQSIHSTGSAAGKPTPLLAIAPGIRGALSSFDAPILHARLSRLRSRASIRTHRDYPYACDQRWSFERGFIRIHVPILTDERVSWRLAGERIDMRAGEAWYLNVCLPHSVENASDSDRIHLVLELAVNDWLRRLFPPETAWDRLRGLALRRLEQPMFRLAKPFLARVPRRRSAGYGRSVGDTAPATRDEIPPPAGDQRSEGAIGKR